MTADTDDTEAAISIHFADDGHHFRCADVETYDQVFCVFRHRFSGFLCVVSFVFMHLLVRFGVALLVRLSADL